MRPLWTFCVILWTGILYFIGITIFTRGFLLSRFVVANKSKCEADFKHPPQKDEHGHAGCWMHARYKRAVILIIDALRYDFLHYNTSLETSDALPYENKLTSIKNLMVKHPRNSRIYKFVADPPTTTLQRLKGLTTGSLPTFVDAGANFASYEITEDNLIDQFVNNNKRITFMGDDTWMGLFPNRFKKAYHFPSFNVRDLHTVDNGVLKHLMPEMRNKDWDILIAHFLGVDHCGHRYGPNHPAMADKLKQMNSVIRNVTENLAEDTILFVFGDHGMTRSGDHGGDSHDELNAGLFVYSPTKISADPSKMNKHAETVSQVDIVPTIALLLGVPIPFSNLGSIIPDLFSHCPWWKTEHNPLRKIYHVIKALHLNAHQVQEYLDTYVKTSSDFPSRKYHFLKNLFEEVEDQLQKTLTKLVSTGDDPHLRRVLEDIQKKYLVFLNEAKGACQAIWAKFDIPCIALGVSITLIALLYSVMMLRLSSAQLHTFGFPYWACSFVSLVYVLVFYLFHDNQILMVSFSALGACLGIIGLMIYKVVFTSNEYENSTSDQNRLSYLSCIKNDSTFVKISIAAYAIYSLSLFSNSYVVTEDAVVSFLIQSHVWLLLWQILSAVKRDNDSKETLYRKSRFQIGQFFSMPDFKLFIIIALFSISVRLSFLFRACREEQATCEPTSFLQSLASLPEKSTKRNWRYFLSVICLSLFPIGLWKWTRHFGNLNGISATILCVKYFIPIATICICLFWAQQALPQKFLDKLSPWNVELLPRIVFTMFLCCVVSLIFKPLAIFMPSQRNSSSLPLYPSSLPERVIPQVYNHVKLNWQKYLYNGTESAEVKPPMVYGLATVYSAPCIVLLVSTSLLAALLLRDGITPSIFLLMIAILLILEINAIKTVLCTTKDGTVATPWTILVVWNLLATLFFFTSGHQMVITTIQWDSAFVGFHGDHKNIIIPALLILINTFASQIIFALALPLVVFSPYVHGQWFHEKDQSSSGNKGEFTLAENGDLFQQSVFRLLLGYLSVNGFRLLCSMCVAALHRRHLMVWKIFAPRFVFEAVSFIITYVIILLMLMFIQRLHLAISNWTFKLTEKMNKNFGLQKS